MRAIVASSTAARTEEALLDVVSQLYQARRVGRNDGCALVFASEHHALHARALASALSDILHPEPFIGWFGAEAFGGAPSEEGIPRLVVLVLEGCVAVARTTPQRGPGGVIAAGLCAELPPGSVRFLATAADRLDVRSVLTALDEQWSPVVGAAGDGRGAAGPTALGPRLGEEPSAALLAASGVRSLIGVTHGVRSVGPVSPYRQAKGSVLTTVGNRPAYSVLREDLRRAGVVDLFDLPKRLLCGVRASPDDEFSLLQCLGIGTTSGDLHLEDEIPDEGEAFFALRDDAIARAELEEMLGRMKDALDARRRIACVIFSDRDRDQTFFGAPRFEAERVEDVLGGEGIPVVGISGTAQYGAEGGVTLRHRHACVVCVLYVEP
ncbi:MAG: FIST N-terminal domain-containing protein [Myxococcota bacterium]